MPLDHEDYAKDEMKFILTIFQETNEHIRATDHKNVAIAGSYMSLIAVILGLVGVPKVEAKTFILLTVILTIGIPVLILQLWYRAWKEHYLDVCRNIASKFYYIEEKCLMSWLAKERSKKFSADKFLFIMTAMIIFIVFVYSFYVMWEIDCMMASITIAVEVVLYYLIYVFRKKIVSISDNIA